VRTRIGTFAPEDATDGAEPARTATGRQGLAASGQLFTEVRLAANTDFLVQISGQDGAVDELASILPADREDVLTVGRSRTVMGFVTVEWRPPEPLPSPVVAEGDHHTLVALSDLILLDRFQRHLTALDRGALAALLRVPAAEVELLPGGQQRTTAIGGWDGPNRMPTAIDRAIRAGSTARFRAPREAVERLAADPWVGWRNREGHGWVALDWPGHRAAHRRQQVATAPASPGAQPGQQQLASGAEQAVGVLVARTGKDLTPTVWSQLEDAVRRGEDLTARRGDRRPETERRDAQSASGRGTGSGERRRKTRQAMIEVTLEAFTGQLREGGRVVADLGWQNLAQPARVTLVEHMGREIRLRELQRRRTAARRRELGVHHRAGEGTP
jgi:hypothetical protein